MKTPTKKERRAKSLDAHYGFLERFSEFLGNKQDGKKLSLYLLKVEYSAHREAERYCNGEITAEQWEGFVSDITDGVTKKFGVAVPGFFVNGDPRGYALKIDDEAVRSHYPTEIGFHRDMGGYGILSPEIEG